MVNQKLLSDKASAENKIKGLEEQMTLSEDNLSKVSRVTHTHSQPHTHTHTHTQTHTHRLKMIGFISQPYTVSLQTDLLRLSTSGTVSEVCRFNALLGKMFANAACEVVMKCGLKMEEISIIGSHG